MFLFTFRLLEVLFNNNVMDICMWYASVFVSWRLTAADSYKETTAAQFIFTTKIMQKARSQKL